MKYNYKSGETFSYKWWSVKVEDVFFGHRISFSIDGSALFFAIVKAAGESGISNDNKIKSRLESAVSESTIANYKVIDSIKVFHTFNLWEKCRRDAMLHIDTVLGDGLAYAKKHNSMPSLSMFL